MKSMPGFARGGRMRPNETGPVRLLLWISDCHKLTTLLTVLPNQYQGSVAASFGEDHPGRAEV